MKYELMHSVVRYEIDVFKQHQIRVREKTPKKLQCSSLKIFYDFSKTNRGKINSHNS